MFRKICTYAINYVILYLQISCIHGIRYLVKRILLIFERLLWLALLIASIYFCIVVSLSSVDRYYTKSTHIGLERNYHFWNTTLPSLTLCPMERLNQSFLDKFCMANGIEGRDKAEFEDFLENLANSTYTNFHRIPQYQSTDDILERLNIRPENYMELIYNMTYDSSYDPIEKQRTRSIDGQTNIHVRQVLTEYGLCYLGNSKLGEEYSSRYFIFGLYPEFNRHEHTRKLLQVQIGSFFEKDVGYTLLGLRSEAIDSFIHSPFDVMKVDNNFGYTDDGVVYDPESQEVIAEENFEKEATIAQRKCRFYHESNLTHFKFYTRNICQQECRINLAYKICKCIPHFYPNRIATPKQVCSYKTLKTCFPQYTSKYSRDAVGIPNGDFILIWYSNIAGRRLFYCRACSTVAFSLVLLFEGLFLKLYGDQNSPIKRATCYCEQTCLDAVVTTKSALPMRGSRQLLGSIGSAISMKTWPQNRLKRQVIFTFTDLLVSIGSTAGLFLGFSVLGLVELIYFFTIRLICQILGFKI